MANPLIPTLQQALNCAGNCDCCAKLQIQINNLTRRIAEVERKNQPKSNSNIDLSTIERRLKKAEIDILDLGGVIKSIIDDLKDLLDTATEHTETANKSQDIFAGIISFFINE